MICRHVSLYTDSPFVWMYEAVGHEIRLSVVVNLYLPSLDTGTGTNNMIRIGIDFFSTDFPFDHAWCLQCAQYWLNDLSSEEQARHTDRDPSVFLLAG